MTQRGLLRITHIPPIRTSPISQSTFRPTSWAVLALLLALCMRAHALDYTVCDLGMVMGDSHRKVADITETAMQWASTGPILARRRRL